MIYGTKAKLNKTPNKTPNKSTNEELSPYKEEPLENKEELLSKI